MMCKMLLVRVIVLGTTYTGFGHEEEIILLFAVSELTSPARSATAMSLCLRSSQSRQDTSDLDRLVSVQDAW